MAVPFVDLTPKSATQKDEIQAAIQKVIEHGQFILGPEVAKFEAQLGAFAGGCQVVSCANGTDALILSLLGLGIGSGDLVFCPSFTYVATAEAIVRVGATPVFVDIDRRTYTMCPADLATTLSDNKISETGRPAAIIAVDLFGQLADYPRLSRISRQYGMPLISDSAQALGATIDDQMAPVWADIVTTSFYPTKPLGCYGDGGAILTRRRDGLVEKLKSLRFHGREETLATHKYIGLNSRLDTIQAAILAVKLGDYPAEILKRRHVANAYTEALAPLCIATPTLATRTDSKTTSIWSQYTVEIADPNDLAAQLARQGIASARFYATPVHTEKPYAHFPQSPSGLSNAEAAARHVLSLPISAHLTDAAIREVVAGIADYCGAAASVT